MKIRIRVEVIDEPIILSVWENDKELPRSFGELKKGGAIELSIDLCNPNERIDVWQVLRAVKFE
jgi:hypothetical protein